MGRQPVDPEFFAGVALGYRAWLVRDGELWPLWHRPHPWQRGVTFATCTQDASHDHRAVRNCECGLHAHHTLTGAGHVRARTPEVSSFIVIGAVAGAFEVQVHHDGWRAAEAQILGLWLDYGRHEEAIALLARSYGVPTFRSVAELEAYLPPYVAEIPLASRPPAPKEEDDFLPFPYEQ